MKTIILSIIALTLIPMSAYGASYYGFDSDESVKAWTTANAWKQAETTIFVSVCDSWNKGCRYGTERYMVPYADITLSLYEHADNDLVFLESSNHTAQKNGKLNLPILIDERFQQQTQYRIIVETENDSKHVDFWVHEKHY